MSPITCPEYDHLSKYLNGQLAVAEMDSVSDHLDSCPECELAARELESVSDPLIDDLLRSGGDACFEEEPQLQQALSGMQEAATGKNRIRAESLPVGTRIGVYEILGTLGAGGMGAVYRALHTELEKQVALKLLPAERTADTAAVARFRREMKAIGRLSHANLVQAHDAGEADGVWYLVMDLVDGCDVQNIAERIDPLSMADACEIVRQAALGLIHAHQQGIIHRDIKPSNLMLTSSGTVKVLDLGLARLVGATADAHQTGSGMIIGTIDYMAPEQAGSGHESDARTDVYGLGATLYRLLTGQAPFAGPVYDTTLKKVAGIARDDVTAVRSLRPEVPEELSRFVDRMLAKDPAHRPASAADVMEALTPFAAECDLENLFSRVQPHLEPRPAVDPSLQKTDCNIADTNVGPAHQNGSPSTGRRPSRLAAVAIPGLVGVLVVAFVVLQNPMGVFKSTGTDSPERNTVSESGSEEKPKARAQGPQASREAAPSENSQGPDVDQAAETARKEPTGPAAPVAKNAAGEKQTIVPLAVLPFRDRSDGLKLGDKLADVVYAGLTVDSGFILLERSDLAKILDEQKLTLSGAVERSQAVQIGQLTGARLLVTGSVSQIDRTLLLVGKVFSTETSRSIGVSVSGKTSDELVPLMEELAAKLKDRIRKDSKILLPATKPQADRIAALRKQLGDAKRPKLWIHLTEEHIGNRTIDPAAETELAVIARAAGFTVIDHKAGSKQQADVIIEGEAFSELATRRDELVSVSARVEVKAVNRASGEAVAVDRQTRIVVGLAEHVAGKTALQNAGSDIAFRLLPKLVKAKP